MRIGRVACFVLPSMLVGSLAAGLIGCSAPASKTDLKPEGPPEVLQLFVSERAGAATALGLAFNANPEYAVDVKGGGPNNDMANGCGDAFDEFGDDCKVTDAVTDPTQKMRIIFDELLNGSTVEEFVCACAGATPNCPNMVISSLDPSKCADNPDTTADEASRWLDVNNDGMPDKAKLVTGIVTFFCDDTMLYSTAADDGFYNPSGNQLIPVATKLAGLGPALVVTAKQGLKTSAKCRITIGSNVTDKQGELVPALPTTVTFQTEALAVLKSTPTEAATGVKIGDPITLVFNAPVKDTAAAGIVLKAGATVVPATITLSDDKTTVTVKPNAPLAVNTAHTVEVPVSVTDKYGGAYPAATTLTFTTGAM